jgi:hypothetical protein
LAYVHNLLQGLLERLSVLPEDRYFADDELRKHGLKHPVDPLAERTHPEEEEFVLTLGKILIASF